MKKTDKRPRSQVGQKVGAHFDAKKLVQDLGGRTRIPGALRELGIASVTEAQVDKWLYRNRLSSPHLAALLLLAQLERRPVNIYLYIKDTRKP
jgi:hypothetical protein